MKKALVLSVVFVALSDLLFGVDINEVNLPPVLEEITNKSVTEGETLNFDVAASDGNNDTIVLTVYNLPVFASFTDHGDGSGTVDVNPQTGDAGTYTDVKIVAFDGTDKDSITFSIEVLSLFDPNQKMNLDAPVGKRFLLTDQTWPLDFGESEVCLWNDDKIGAASLTIDDNIESDFAWWLSMQSKYKLVFTWFTILDNVTSWNKYQALVDAGNEIQGHDDCDINEFSDEDYSAALENTKSTIESNLINNPCITYAYPCGIADKSEVARNTYISMRGVVGLINHANKIDYLNLCSRSASNDTHDVDILLDENETLWNTSYYRGWLSYHYHGISSIKVETEAFLNYLSQHAGQVWIGKYSEIARYGQERDSHILHVDEKNDSIVKFTLTDEMNDTYFDYPLTVKMKASIYWESVVSIQNGDTIESSMIYHEGVKYVLVKAIPDRGQVTVKGLINHDPMLDEIADQTVEETKLLSVNISASDEDGDSIAFSALNLPAFAALTDNEDGTGEITFEPQKGDAGIYDSIIIIASDGISGDSVIFSLMVNKLSGLLQLIPDNDFLIYPNPSGDGVFYIESVSGNGAVLEVMNSSGKILFRKGIAWNRQQTTVITDLSRCGAGVYFVKLQRNNRVRVKKIILN